MTGLCKFDGNLFCFFLPTHKREEETPPTLQHVCKAPHAHAQTKSLQKSGNLVNAQVLIRTVSALKIFFNIL